MTCTTGSGKSKKICLSAGQSEKLLSRNSVNIPNFIQCQHSQFHIDVWTFPGDYLILSSFWKSKEAGVWCHWGHTTETTKAIFPMKMKHGQKGTQWFYWTFFYLCHPLESLFQLYIHQFSSNLVWKYHHRRALSYVSQVILTLFMMKIRPIFAVHKVFYQKNNKFVPMSGSITLFKYSPEFNQAKSVYQISIYEPL